jgi:ActR/RegA family two-component response regulator
MTFDDLEEAVAKATDAREAQPIIARFVDRQLDDARKLARAGDARQRQAATLATVEAEHLRRVLAVCAGNKSAAAHILDIDRRSLQRKLIAMGRGGAARKAGKSKRRNGAS